MRRQEHYFGSPAAVGSTIDSTTSPDNIPPYVSSLADVGSLSEAVFVTVSTDGIRSTIVDRSIGSGLLAAGKACGRVGLTWIEQGGLKGK